MTIMRPFVNYGVLGLFLLVIVGCSAFRGVSVVSHGDEVAQVEEPDPSATIADPPIPAVDQDLLAETSSSPPSPPDSPLTFPDENKVIEEDIFAQSAEDTTLPWTLQDIFFDYDQMAIRPDAVPLLEQNAKVLLKRHAKREVLIQGHCDERGTEAYNLILGERRAKAVKDFLVNLGVEDSRMRVLSLGKSQPFCLERTLPCFQQNRRAHFVLK